MASFGQQLKALVWRNILLKIRNNGQLFQELMIPVYYVGSLALIHALLKPEAYPARKFPKHDLSDDVFEAPFSDYRTLLVVPDTPQAKSYIQNVVAQLPGSPGYKLFASKEAAEAEYRLDKMKVAAGIIFNFNDDPYTYVIRTDNVLEFLNMNLIPAGCSDDKNINGASRFCSVNKYLFSGFAQLQVAIENMLMENLSISSGIRSRKIGVQMMDRGEYSPDITYIQIVTSFLLILSFTFIPTFLVVNIVEEKEKKIKDGMMMMGLRNSVFWLSWGIVYTMLITAASSILVIIVSLSGVFKHSNVQLLFLCMILYGNSLISFAFMFTPFFNKAATAGSVMISVMVVLSFIYVAISQTKDAISNDSRLSVSTLLLLCLLSPVAFAMFIDQALYMEISKNGFDFSKGLTYGKFPMGASIVMLIVDTTLYAILTMYFDNVLPGKYGVGKHPLYFLQSSYWCPKQADMKTSQPVSPKHSLSKIMDVEPVGRGMEDKVAMRIVSLTKSFKQKGILLNAVDSLFFKQKGTIHRAVDDFCLDIYEGQITCLLGHNGAGKTTLINMLTGVIAPTSGSAQIMGLDITQTGDLEQIRKRCGICPQHNILSDSLSSREHLELFANIKGVPSHLINTTVEQSLADVDLNSQSETFAKNLSGGQKRKLSVGIALIGDPKLLFLDEPSSGLDPLTRRHLWSLLKRIKEGKVVLLTTHFMDEADILADRKAFMRRGKLCCCGSSLFLKNKFGVGYHLTMVVEPNCHVITVTTLLRSVIPDVKLTRTHGKEISYTIPLQDVSKFSDLFDNLDKVAESLGIITYGVYMTTLEEVFFKLEGDESVDNEEKTSKAIINPGFFANSHNVNADKPPSISEAHSFAKNSEAINPGLFSDGHIVDADKPSSISDANLFGKSTVHGRDLTKQRFRALLKIRFKLKVRSILLVLVSSMMPLGFMIVGLDMIKMRERPPVQISEPTFFNPFMYARRAGLPGPLPPSFLVFDAVNNTGSQAVISKWKGLYTVDTYLAGTKNTSDVAPHLIGVQIDRVIGQNLTDFTVLYNDSAVYSIPVVINMATQNILNSSNINVYINGSSLPWPSKMGQFIYLLVSMATAMLVAVCIILILPTFTYDIVRDRQFKLQSQLHISGVTFNVYWGTIYLCDLLTFFIPVIGIIIAFFAMQIQGFNSSGALGALVLVVATNVPLLLLLASVLSFLYDKAETCAACMPVLLLLPTMIPYTIVPMVDALHSDAAVVIHYIFCVIFPPYIVFGGLYFISRVYLDAFNEKRTVNESEYFDFGKHVMICIIMPIIHMLWMYWLLRILDVKKAGGHMKACSCFFDWTDTSQIVNTDVIDGEDDDVTAERHRIEELRNGDSQAPVAYMSQLRKLFVKRTKPEEMCNPGKVKTKIAVRNLSLGIDQGEVFGLLGPNGAGKSTVLNMMTAQISPTCGKVVIDGHNICYNLSAVLDSLGYCPQDDPLWELITLEEHVECFAAIKGIHPSELNKVVDYVVEKLKLEEHCKKPSVLLSGGTKRKLSYILSMLGSPHFVLLDEPSSSMDPQSKRFLWDTISSSFRGTNRGAILTTHYMEEADALCDRIGIMINGQLKCLGSTQHLKNKYGSGYILEVKLGAHEDGQVETLMDQLEAHLKMLFPGLDRVERFQERAQYSIPKENVQRLGQTFARLEACKRTHNLEEYSFSQCLLEQVFLYFAKQQQEDEVP